MLYSVLVEDEGDTSMTKPVVLVYAEAMEMGGVAVAFCEFAKELESHGYEIRALIPYKSDLDIIRIPKRYVCGTVWRRRVRNRLMKYFLNAFNVLTRWRVYFWLVPKVEHDIFVNYFAFCNSHWSFYSDRLKIGFFHNAVPKCFCNVALSPLRRAKNRIWGRFIRCENERFNMWL